MVRKDGIIVEMVEANSKRVFKEHPGKRGYDAYVEVEPDVEYFLNIRSDNKHKKLLTTIKVDGDDLGYRKKLKYKRNAVLGLRSYENNVSTHTALKVEKMFLPGANTSTLDSISGKKHIGEIKIQVWNKISLEGYTERKKSSSSKWTGGQSTKHKVAGTGKKIVNSTKGSATLTRKSNNKPIPKGPLYSTILIKYCSAVGLVQAGVLPKSPAFELAQMTKPRPITVANRLDLKPTPMSFSIRGPDGELIQDKQVEMFDLTQISDDEDIIDSKMSTILQDFSGRK